MSIPTAHADDDMTGYGEEPEVPESSHLGDEAVAESAHYDTDDHVQNISTHAEGAGQPRHSEPFNKEDG